MKKILLMLTLTLGITFSFANGSTNNLPVNESSTSFTNLIEKIDLSKELVSAEVNYLSVEDDCTWTKYIRVTTRTYIVWGFISVTEVETEFVWRCV